MWTLLNLFSLRSLKVGWGCYGLFVGCCDEARALTTSQSVAAVLSDCDAVSLGSSPPYIFMVCRFFGY